MEIRIENLRSAKNVLLIVLAIAMLTSGSLDLIPMKYGEWNTRLIGIGILVLAFFYLKLFRRNYIGYTSKRMFISIGKLSRKSIWFNQIEHIKIENGLLQIDLQDGEQLVLDLDEADPDRRKELNVFLQEKVSSVA
ncbi:hypothetical protein [Mangrovibacterium lignilyticum]|uniref:hypothetical protein n=1 Tax=Mangrovibacterium lignilyticum TaxID=2668052 RepID=UPI0013D2F383|nr:hypothetical protein [Mangrovibacterium lignilyticum]